MDPDTGVAVKRALLSAHDATVVIPLARSLSSRGAEIWATSGTRKKLESEGIESKATEDLTGVASWFGGRVKTLHPSIFGGILAPRDEEGTSEMKAHGVLPFDLVAVHLYPFEDAIEKGITDEVALTELVDIGGVSLLRAAAKNFRWVVPVPSVGAAQTVLAELESGNGKISLRTRRILATETFSRTHRYDSAIFSWLSGTGPGETVVPDMIEYQKTQDKLRYGENPHQKAWVFTLSGSSVPMRPWPLTVIKGDTLSYNNYLDIDNSMAVTAQFEEPAAAVVKHATPCGVATGDNVHKALEAALETDPVARYGCVIALNRPVTAHVLDAMKGTFVDLLIAPGFEPQAVERLSKRTKLKAVSFRGAISSELAHPRIEARSAAGALLVEECDQRVLKVSEMKQVTKRAATKEEMEAMMFAWKVVRHVKSNAIVLAKNEMTVGIGGGQTSRVGAVKTAVEVAGSRSKGSSMASDAYFPFIDGVEEAGKAGVTAIVHPGGSIRDAEVIAAANSYGMAMYTTGWRIFKH